MPFRGIRILSTLLVIDAVSDGGAGNRSGCGTKDCAAEGITTTTVMSDDRPGDSTQRTAGDRALLGVRPGSHAATQERGKREQRYKWYGSFHGR
jgi:hypothetical protein